MLRQLLIASALAASLPAYAGLFDTLNAVSQVAASATGKTTNTTPSAETRQYDVTPMPTDTVAVMDCPTLEITTLSTKRELDTVKANLQQIDALSKDANYQQQKKVSGTIGALGGLLAGKGGKTGEYAQAAQQLGGNGEVADSMNPDLQLALAKKYNTDLETIKVYQKHKKCK
ncbi:MAG: hypothetical protein EOO69_02875 [Moraxellaceae bacterium]|nr:MAG: hypothetical protein EOO69_02875 [Moraxellaceae bacterium]